MKTPPPDPGVGYRLLKPPRGKFRGEIIREGDEFLLNGKWHVSSQDGDRQRRVGPRSRGGDPWRRRRTDEPIPAVEALEDAAKKITKDIFTRGDGRVANRLVMQMIEKPIEGAGWCIAAVYDRVLHILKHGEPM